MTWDDVTSVLVGFVGREVNVQLWNSADPEAPNATVILTAHGVLAGSDARFEGAIPEGSLMVRLRRGGETSGTLALRRDLFLRAERPTAADLEITFAGALIGIYAA